MFIYVWALCRQFCCFVKEHSRNKKGVKVNNKQKILQWSFVIADKDGVTEGFTGEILLDLQE